MNSLRALARRRQGFTLVELLAVIAIISVLAAVALPAYNNYSVKSKFAEVVLATAPTKSAISVCAVSGDCIAGNAISLATSGASALPTLAAITAGPNNVETAVNRNPALVYAVVAASYVNGGFSLATATSTANGFATSVSQGLTPYIVEASPTAPGQFCLSTYTNPGSCNLLNATAATTQSFLTAANNPFFAAGGGTTSAPMDLPCVGGSGCSPATKYAASVSYDVSGNITATAQTTSGLNAETFVLIPSYSGGRIDWSASGTCKTRAGGALC